MTRCPSCGAASDPRGAFCANCGARLAPEEEPASSQRAASDTTYTLLARANLLRLRGRWGEASELCAEVLRLEPRNAAAHSLLGDINENAGNLEQAIHWYDLALQLDPESDADEGRKGRVQELLEARQKRAEWAAVLRGRASVVSGRSLSRETIQRVAAILGVAVCAVVLVTAVLVSASSHSSGEPRPDDGSGPLPPRPHRPTATASAAASERERADLAELTRVGSASNEHGQVVGLLISARADEATLSVVPTAAVLRLPTLPGIREGIERDCYWMAHALFATDRLLRRIHVRALEDTEGFGPTRSGRVVLFEATLPAENLVVDPNLRPPTPADLAAFYEKPWWHSALRG